jgi:predicted dinucleotide-binding enzyme
VAQWTPGARVVKAFNHLIAAALGVDTKVDGGGVLFLSCPDADAKQTVGELITRLGYAPVDLGGVEQSRLVQFPGGPLTIRNLVQLG